MSRTRLRLGLAILPAFALALAFGGTALAEDPPVPGGVPGEPKSGDGVVPWEYDGNVSCQSLGFQYGFKIEGNGADVYTGTFPFDLSNGGLHTGGAPDDALNNVVLASDGYYLNWASSLGIDAVIMKGGQDSNAYVYIPEDTGDSGLAAPGLDNGNQPMISHVEFCYDYELTATKSAYTRYTRTYTWDIDKTVAPDSHTGFAGDTFSSDYDVAVDQTVVDSGFEVYGSIVVNNPTTGTVTFSVADSVGGVAASVTCPTNTLTAGASTTCTYVAAFATKPADGTNTATVTSNTAGVGGATATAAYAFGDPTTVVGYSTVNVSDSVQGSLGAASGDKTFEYSDDFACSTDATLYKDGFYTFDVPNTATITETKQSDDAKVTVKCYLWDVAKTADGTYNDQYTWDITKTVDPASQDGFAGDTLDWTWSITWASSFEKEINHAVSGVITVTNPAPMALTVAVDDYLWNGAEVAATVVCNDADKGTSLTVAANSTGTCDYTSKPGYKLPNNTATATRSGVSVSTTVDVKWVKGADVGLDAVISDSNNVTIPVDADQPYTYTDQHVCSTDPKAYTGGNGKYTGSASNTATITWTGGTDSSKADTSYACYAPVISKTADTTTYDQFYEWDVDKTVTPESQHGFPGDVLGWTWSVSVTRTTLAADNALVSGVITVTNPHPAEQMVVGLTDKLSDGTVATIFADADCSYADGLLTIPAASTATCDYSAEPANVAASQLPDQNKAKATLGGGSFAAYADITWVPTAYDESAILSDDEIGLNETLSGASSYGPFTGKDSITCSSTRADYFKDGVYTSITDTIVNWAYVHSNDVLQDKDDATTTWTCNAGFVDVLKTTNGKVDPTKDIRFQLYKGATALGDPVSTLGDADGRLQFPKTLTPGETYTVCESPVPAGYTFEITRDGVLVSTYAGPPGTSNPTGEVQCFDFVALKKTTILFEIENSYPGGAPRTPGYWKNWNTCTGGNQDETAAKLGGPDEGVYLLDDLLPQTVGLLTIGDGQCQVGVYVLDGRWSTGSKAGTTASGDAAYTLARAYLAALLNKDAGACIATQTFTVPGIAGSLTFTQVMEEAQKLLVAVGYDGNDALLTSKVVGKNPVKVAQQKLAVALYGIIDDYNNSELCTGDPSH